VAYVYVSSAAPTGGGDEIQAYSATSSGALTPISGSPFAGDVTQLAVSNSQLIAVNRNGFDLESYAVSSGGALTHETTTDAGVPNPSGGGNCNSLGQLFFDNTGTTVYDLNFRGSDCANNTYESFSVGSNGALTALGNSSGNNFLSEPAAFIAGDEFAYTASCIADEDWIIAGFQRASNGLLTEVNAATPPSPPPAGHFYCPSIAATDNANHVAIAMQPVNNQTFTSDEPEQIGVYTAASDGSLTTTSTAANMPQVQVGTVNDLKISTSGRLLAVAGTTGLQVFDFNGANPVTPGAGLLTSDSIDQIAWDSAGILYALSRSTGKLYVFVFNGYGVVAAPGSPYTIAQPQNLTVLPVS
jgi:hypothetical protein